MLTQSELIDLYRTHRHDRVLSIYLDGRTTDFSQRNLWRKHLDAAVSDARKRLDGESDRGDFEGAFVHLQKTLNGYDQYLPDRGWVGFATSRGLIEAHPCRVPMPDLARWEDGLRVAPYVRALKQARVVITVIVDSRRARLFEYRNGELHEPKALNADRDLGDMSDVNVSKRGTTYSGVRGKTATDAAQRTLEVEAERLFKQLLGEVSELMGKDGLLILGGPAEAVAAARAHLPSGLQGRAQERTSLRMEMSEAEVKAELEAGASELNQALQRTLLDEVVELARSGGRGALGVEKVEAALRAGQVDTLLLSRAFIRSNADYADHLVGAAFEHHGEVEELAFEGGDRLDAVGEGVAARLRYTI